MIFVALLRGINVGGNNKVPMKQLGQICETIGLTQVKTYINSGNVIFQSELASQQLSALLETAIETEFGFKISVQIRDFKQIAKTVLALPDDWINNVQMRCNVLFLAPTIDSPDIIDLLPINPPIDEVKYVSGAIFWKIDRANTSKSKINKLVGTKMYKQMTIRNSNTVRKLHTLMMEIAERKS